jgi:hypothetical protein
MNIRICPPCLFTILGASNDIEEISVSGKYGTTSDDTYNILLSFINLSFLELKIKNMQNYKNLCRLLVKY